MVKIKILLVLLLIATLTTVSAEKVTQTNINPNEGLTVFYPKFEVVQQNSTFKLHLHVANISTGLTLNNTKVDCFLHLYNLTGDHTLESGVLGKDSNGWDHELTISSGNFTAIGIHAFYIWCNATNIGGEASGTFIVSIGGEEMTSGRSILLLGLILLIFVSSCFFLYLSMQMGEVGFKIFFLLMAMIFLLASFITTYIIFLEGSIMVKVNVVTLTLSTILGMVLFIIFIYIMIRQTINALDMFRINKGLKMSPDYNVGSGRKVAGYDTKRAY